MSLRMSTWVTKMCRSLLYIKTISLVCILFLLLLYYIYSLNAWFRNHVKLISSFVVWHLSWNLHWWKPIHSFIHSFIPLVCAECDDSLLFSGASSIPLCYVLFRATLLHQLFFHRLKPHLAIYFLVYLSILLVPNSYIIPFWEFCFLPFSVNAQTNIIYLTLLSLL